MANVIYGGFHPVDESKARATRYEVASSYGTAIARGDVMTVVTAGVAEVATAGDSDFITGVCKEVSYVSNGVRIYSTYMPATTVYSPTSRGSRNASYVWVWDDPSIEYWVNVNTSHADSDTAAEVYALVGANMDHVATAPDSVYKRSNFTLDGNSIEATAQWRIKEVRRIPGNDLASIGFQLRVQINEGFHPFYSAAGI